jgi:putative iron-dependent peroxidase
LQVARAIARVPSITEKVGALDRRAKLVCTAGIGPEFFTILSPDRCPKGLRPFKTIAIDGRTAPNTGGDLLFHIISKRADLNFELALRVMGE